MAFLPQQDEEKDKKLTEEQGAAPGVQTSAPTGTLDPTVSPAAGGPAAGGGDSGGGAFSNITSYIAKNRPASQRLADQVGTYVQGKGQAARDTLGQQTGMFNNAVASKETQNDAGLQNQILTNPTGLSADQNAKVKSMRDASYTGPKSLEETDFYQPVSQAFGAANTARTQLGSTGGRQELLASVSDPTKRLSKGRLTLDEALLSADPNARGTLGTAKNSLSDLDKRLSDASAAAQARAKQAADTTAATQAATRSTLGTARTNFEGDLNGRLSAAQAEALKRQNAAAASLEALRARTFNAKDNPLPDALQSRAELYNPHDQKYLVRGQDTFDDQQLADLGLSRQQIDEIMAANGTKTAGYLSDMSHGTPDNQVRSVFGRYGDTLGDLTRFLTKQSPEAQITRGNLASKEDYARLAALNDLSGEQNLYLNPNDVGQAGTANLDTSDFDRAGFSDAYQQAMTEAQKKAELNAYINSKNGSDSFLKKHGASIATGGLVRQGGSLADYGSALVNPFEAGRQLASGYDNPADPAMMFSEAGDEPGAKLKKYFTGEKVV